MQFLVRAVRPGEGLVEFRLEAPDARAAERQAATRGVVVLSLQPAADRTGFGAAGRGTRRLSLPLFAQELVSLLRAGMNIVEALETLEQKEDSRSADIVRPLTLSLREGRTLSQAMEAQGDVFPPLFVATVRASERTGDLADALIRYLDYDRQMSAVRKKIVSSSIYPLILLAVGGIVTLFLLGYVVPKFSSIYADSNRDLPFLSRVLLDWGRLVEAHMGLVVVAGIATVALIGLLLTRLRGWLLQRAWEIPAIGRRLLVYQLARYYRTLGMLLRGGIAIVPALEMSIGLLHPALQPRVQGAKLAIQRGVALSAAMNANGLTTVISERLLRVGERTGDMPDMMDRIAGTYDDDLARWVDWFTRLFEPLLMAAIGLVIGTVVVLMYLPIFELAGSLE